MNGKATGAQALQDLLRQLGDQAEGDVQDTLDDEGAVDLRDYRAMSVMVQQSIEDNFHNAEPAHAEGYLRALTDLLSIVADGCNPGEDWNPLRDTEAAFAAPGLAAAAVERMRTQ